MNYFKIFFSLFLVVSCQTSSDKVVTPLPAVQTAPKEPTKTSMTSLKDIKPVVTPMERVKNEREALYVPENNLKIAPAAKNTSGSLYSPSHLTSNFILDNMPVAVGSVIDLIVSDVRSDETSESASLTEKDPDALTQELLESLPTLAPEDTSNRKALTKIKASVIDRLPNGDLVVESQRRSETKGSRHSVYFRAIIPSSKVSKSNLASVKDLSDVVFQEYGTNGFVERVSSSWEDEYTLRYSGFKEVPSKLARKLEGDRQSLVSMRDRFKNRLTSFKKERDKIAREREKLYEENNSIKRDMAKKATELDDAKKSISSLEQKVKDLETKLSGQGGSQQQAGSGTTP